MKRFCLVVVLVLMNALAQGADVAISSLPAASALGGTEVAPVVQSGSTKKATIDQIKDYVTTGLATAGTITTGNLCRATSATDIACDVNAASEMIAAVPDIYTASVTFTALAAAGSRTVANYSEIVVCAGACTVTPPATLTAGMQLCVANDVAVTTVITLAASTNITYSATSNASTYSANRKLLSTSGETAVKICLLAVSTTKYIVMSSSGTWTDTP